jgi:hypothetical protein
MELRLADEIFSDNLRVIPVGAALSRPHDSSDTIEWPEPEALVSELPPVMPFDPALLPSSLRSMVLDVAERMQVPIDYPAVAAVAALGGVVGRRALIQPKRDDTTWIVVPNLWGGVVAPPGAMKSPVLTAMVAPLRAIEGMWRQEDSRAVTEFEMARERAELDQQAWKDTYRAAQKAGRELPEKPTSELERPSERRLLCSDATFESLHTLLAVNPGGLFLQRDELAGWLAGLDRQGREQERAFALESWNGDSSFTVDRIGRGRVHVEHCCLSIFGGIQPSRIRGYLAEALRDGPLSDGLIQRFGLLVWPDERVSWTYIDGGPDVVAIQRAAEVYRCLASLDPANPLVLKFDPTAQLLFRDWISDLERRIRSRELSPAIQAHLSKFRKLMPRPGAPVCLGGWKPGLRCAALCTASSCLDRISGESCVPSVFIAVLTRTHSVDRPRTKAVLRMAFARGLVHASRCLPATTGGLEDASRSKGSRKRVGEHGLGQEAA